MCSVRFTNNYRSDRKTINVIYGVSGYLLKEKIMTEFLQRYAPNFCWVSFQDLLAMAHEYFGPNVKIRENVLRVALCNLHKKKVFISQPDDKASCGGRIAKKYLRVR